MVCVNLPALRRACWIGVRQSVSEPLVLVGLMIVYWAFLLALSQVLRAVSRRDLAALHVTGSALIWYLIVSEIVLTFGSFDPTQMQDEIETGAIEVMLLRPVDFWQLKLADWFGQALVRFAVLGVFCSGIGLWMTGEWIWSVGDLAYVTVSLLAAGLMMLCGNFLIGSATIRIGQTLPLYWIWEKAIFLMGGLYWPLLFYPAWYRHMVWVTPFPAMMAAPSNAALGLSFPRMLAQLADQMAWLIGLLAACRWAAGRIRRHFQARGG